MLDGAAIKLHEVEYALIECQLCLGQHGASFFDDPSSKEAHLTLGRLGKQLDALFERLRIRFDQTDEVVVAFRAANKATLAIYHSFGGLQGESNLLREVRTETAKERKRFDSERTKFVEAAQRAAGARLRLPPIWRAFFE